MNYVYLKDFLENYSLPTLTIAVLVSVIVLIYDKFLSAKSPKTIRNFLPFVLAIALYFAYNAIFVCRAFVFSADAFSAGILSGSLSVIITSSFYKIKSGKPIAVNAVAIIIESLIAGYVNDSVLSTTANLIGDILDKEPDLALEKVTETITENSSTPISAIELKSVSSLIIKAVTAIKNR